LVRGHLSLICSILSSSIRNRSDVDDLAQETFLKAWQSLPSLKAGAQFKPWLCRIAINLAHDDRRRSASLRSEPVVSSDHPDREPSVVKKVLGRELQDLIQQAIANLPEDLGLVFVLRVIEQRSYEEVAEILRIQPQTVRSQVARARRMLMDSLARMRGEGGVA
jgi:RNA polymerase sigma-70 factor (ECF subfamily)